MDLTGGSFRLFRVAGINVYLHWSWFLVAGWEIGLRDTFVGPEHHYRDLAWIWKVVEYISLFAIVLMHEFGHVLACRSVGGRADQIVLWPFGGIAYVAPPARPGAVLWSIAAGPLVNFVLILPTILLCIHAHNEEWNQTFHDPYLYLWMVTLVNAGLFLFNLLPIYPLDGGQILHALLWFVLGRWRSLQVVSLVGVGLGGMLFIVSLLSPTAWPVTIIAAFMVFRSWVSFQQSRAFLDVVNLPRHEECACPHCGIGPPKGLFWVCEHCHTRFDLFDTRGKCPACGAWYLEPNCPHCRHANHIDRWFEPPPIPSPRHTDGQAAPEVSPATGNQPPRSPPA